MSGQDYRVPPQNRESIRSIVRSLRSTFGITGFKFPVMEVIEFALPQLIPDFELHIGGMKEMGETHGLTYPRDSLLILREDIYDGALNGVGRDRMTAAHELGICSCIRTLRSLEQLRELKFALLRAVSGRRSVLAGNCWYQPCMPTYSEG